MKAKKVAAGQTPEQHEAEKESKAIHATESAEDEASEDGPAILPKKQKGAGKQIMDAIGSSLLKPKAPKVPNGPSTQKGVQVRKDISEKSKDASKSKK